MEHDDYLERLEHELYWAVYDYADHCGILALHRIIGDALDQFDRDRRVKRGNVHSDDPTA